MRLALIGVPGAEAEAGYSAGNIPAEHAIRGFHGVSLLLADATPTGAILTDVFGFAGAIYGHLIMGLDLTIMSMFGLVALGGIKRHVRPP